MACMNIKILHTLVKYYFLRNYTLFIIILETHFINMELYSSEIKLKLDVHKIIYSNIKLNLFYENNINIWINHKCVYWKKLNNYDSMLNYKCIFL